MTDPAYTTDEMMTVAAARALAPGLGGAPKGAPTRQQSVYSPTQEANPEQRARAYRRRSLVCFVGIGLPSTAANLARRLHAADQPGRSLVLVYESGCIGSKPDRLPASIGDGVLADGADALVGVPEIFSYWLQAGRIDVGFLGAAQIDRYANLNTTVIGPYDKPKVRLPGAGGAPEIAANCGEVIVTLRHNTRAFVDDLDFVTSFGHGEGGDHRERLGLRGRGPAVVITDLGVLRPDPATKELALTSIHPGVSLGDVQDATSWPLKVADPLTETPAPTPDELRVLRALQAA